MSEWVCSDSLGRGRKADPELISTRDQERFGVFTPPDCDARRMESIGKGVWELKASDERTWYRVIYLARIRNALYVLHAFEKTSKKTDRRDLEIAKSRLSKVLAQMRAQTEDVQGEEN